jgi:TonB family protein
VILNPGGKDDPGSLGQIRFLPMGAVIISMNSDPAHPEALQSLVHKIFAFSLDEALAGKTPEQRRSALFTLASLVAPAKQPRAVPSTKPDQDQAIGATGLSAENPAPIDKIMRPGGRVSAPQVTHSGNPEYTDEARKKKVNGICILSLVVDTAGFPIHIYVLRSLDPGLDEKAIAAVSQYRFQPSMFKGNPVAVEIDIEVNFKLY